MIKELFLIVLLFSAAGKAIAFPTYPAQLPNGIKVPCPTHFDAETATQQCQHSVCKGVGHIDCRGGEFPNASGEFLNDFGKAFRNAGYQWTKELCEADSDGDGKTNGEELGDPCCIWQLNQPSPVGSDYVISHPGHPDDTTSSAGPTAGECKVLQESQGTASAFDREAFVDSMYNEGEPRLNTTFTVQNHTLLANETIYTRVYFPMPQDKDYYVVGFLADIVNKVHVHHFVVYLCTEPFSSLYRDDVDAGFPEQPLDEETNGETPDECQQNFYNWAPGADEFVMPKNMAIKYGKSTPFKSLFLEVHYNNPDGVTDATDSSGFTMFLTTRPREHEAMWWWTGSITNLGTIPPQEEQYFNTAECVVDLKPGCNAVNAVAHMPHAHFLGDAIWTEHYTADKFGGLTYNGDIGREDAYNYELQYIRFFDEEITVKRGDMISSTCVFTSEGVTEPTTGGLGSQEEMCINFLLVYPAECLPSSDCESDGRAVSGSVPPDAQKPYHTADFYSPGGAPNFTAIVEDGLAECNATATLESSLASPTDPPGDTLFVAFFENCPGVFEEEVGFLTPEQGLNYSCQTGCVDYLVNLGVCIASPEPSTELTVAMEQLEGESPLTYAPPPCWEAVTKKLTEAAGGTYTPVTAPPVAQRGSNNTSSRSADAPASASPGTSPASEGGASAGSPGAAVSATPGGEASAAREGAVHSMAAIGVALAAFCMAAWVML